MHIEKNIYENILWTILKLEKKTKHTPSFEPEGESSSISETCYTMSPDEKKKFYDWLKMVNFSDGYASNISRCVSANSDKLSGMKSHDCHVFLQHLLPVIIRGLLPTDVCAPLIELGIFFKELCCKTIRLEMLEKMEKDIAVILCKLEDVFPPSFFDVMVHLAVHLPREAILTGPVHYRWMYPIERFLHTLKLYVRTKARPEGSIAEAYIDSECLTFCSMYLHGIETRFNPEERNCDASNENKASGMDVFTQNLRTLGASEVVMLDLKDYDKAHFYVLNNSEEVLQYINEHKDELLSVNPQNIQQRHEKSFAKWFENRIKQLPMRTLRQVKMIATLNECFIACQVLGGFYIDMALGGPRPTRQLVHAEQNATAHDSITINDGVGDGKRKKTRNKFLKKYLKNSNIKPRIVIEEGMMTPVAEWSQAFITGVNIICRQYAPLNVRGWRKLDSKAKEKLFHDRIKEKFHIDLHLEHVAKAVNRYLGIRFRDFRCKLHMYYKKFGSNDRLKRSKPYSGVSHEKRESICDWFKSDDFQKLSAKNLANKQLQEVNHCAGSVSFARFQHKKYDPETRQPLGRIKLYHQTHFSDKRSSWVAPIAAENYDAMITRQVQVMAEDPNAQVDEGAI